MNNNRSLVLRAAALLLLIFFIYAVIRFYNIIVSISSPFFIAIIIAYIINPLVVFMEGKGIKRIYAISIVYIVIIGSILIVSSYLVPAIYRETVKLVETIPSYTYRIKGKLDQLYISFSQTLTPELKEVIRNNLDSLQGLIIAQINKIVQGVFSVFSSFVNWMIALVISFYLLKDRDYFTGMIKYLIPVGRRQEVFHLFREINRVLTRFIRGQLLIALVVGLLATAGFLLIKLNFALILGIITGAANIIPYFGPIFGGIPVVLVGLMDGPAKALWALGVVVVVQQLESGVITPKIVGESVGVHPVFIILSLFVAAKLLGILGMVIAVPVVAVLKVVFKYLFDKIVYLG